jgi:hypothetical protein
MCIHTLPRTCNFGSYLLTEVGSDAATCPVALDLGSLPRWALALLRAPWPRISPPY